MLLSHRVRTFNDRLLLMVALASAVTSVLAVTPGTVAAATSASISSVNADSPSAYWRLGEKRGATIALDASGRSHPAAVRGAVTLGVPGALVGDSDTAAQLDGKTGYLRTSSPVTVGSDFSIEAWIKPSSANASGTVISLSGSNAARTLYLNGGQLLGMADLTSNWPAFTVFGPTLDASWHYVVFTTTGGALLQLYVDGALAGSAT